jgi:2,3-dihydroxybenzoate decarboxylase
MHPACRTPLSSRLRGLCGAVSSLPRAAWGFTIETATQGLVCAERRVHAYPGLKIILGHLGEGLPLSLVHQHGAGARRQGQELPRRLLNTYITTSGFSPTRHCCAVEMGIDRILFSVDYPFVDNPPGTKWTETLPICAEDKEKLLNGNAKRLLKL